MNPFFTVLTASISDTATTPERCVALVRGYAAAERAGENWLWQKILADCGGNEAHTKQIFRSGDYGNRGGHRYRISTSA